MFEPLRSAIQIMRIAQNKLVTYKVTNDTHVDLSGHQLPNIVNLRIASNYIQRLLTLTKNVYR